LEREKMKGDEVKIILEDVSEKFDTIIEGQNLLNEKLDRHIEDNKEEFKEVKKDILYLKKDVFDIKKDVSDLKGDVSDIKRDVSDLKKDLNEHRENTELHAGKKKKKAS
jgi:chromosome segregation ATPase